MMSQIKKKILVTGVRGFIGKHLKSQLSKLDYNLVLHPSDDIKFKKFIRTKDQIHILVSLVKI